MTFDQPFYYVVEFRFDAECDWIAVSHWSMEPSLLSDFFTHLRDLHNIDDPHNFRVRRVDWVDCTKETWEYLGFHVHICINRP